tara:strand:- start:6524 stop:7321 length:798 start_codon:yes stop_codon:yes gene_type:complete
MIMKKNIITLCFWLMVPNLVMAENGQDHGEDNHVSDSKLDDHSSHSHKKSKKKDKHNHSEGTDDDDHKDHDDEKEDHSGHDHDKSSKTDSLSNDGALSGQGEHSEHSDKDDQISRNDEDEHKEHAASGDHGQHGDEDEHDEHGSSGIGHGKAIVEVADEGRRFKLSSESEAFLKIQTSSVEALGNNEFSVPKGSIVTYENTTGVYIKSSDWFQIEHIKLVRQENGRVIIKGSNIGTGTMIASSGLGFLRAAHLQASGQGGKGHAH